MVYRIYVEKKCGLRGDAESLCRDAVELLGIKSLESVRLINRYDVEGISEELFREAVKTVFSEPQLDDATDDVSLCGARVFAVEYLPGQFDQRADSASQCIQLISCGDRPTVKSAKVYALYGDISDEDLAKFKKYVINPVDSHEIGMEKPDTLGAEYDIPTTVKTLDGFTSLDDAGLSAFVRDYGLAMDEGDARFCRDYFRKEGRDPTVTEIRMIDTYWSDHCRHTTFLTEIDEVKFEDETLAAAYADYIRTREELGVKKPVCLMDIATIAVKYLKKKGKLDRLDESEEINACTVRIDVTVDGVSEPWLLLFKNETHNHPTEIEPFGGASTCIGGAIRDPLSGRAYVYGAMRVTGAADPTRPVSETMPGKLPQRKIVTEAAAGYASYGNQIGLATGIVDEVYHPGYAAKRMEIGAVIAAAPAANVRRERPEPGDVVILLGGATGRDGIGGATGSSKAHNAHSVETCGAEVQKGNAPEERKLQRLFRDPSASRLIKRCNDFGAGGVSVAIGELADGLDIDLDRVPKKYEGLDGTEIAISESQERMAVVVAKDDVDKFLSLASRENLAATPVATVKSDPRLTMTWNGATIVDVSREFLNSNGAKKHTKAHPAAPRPFEKTVTGTFAENMRAMARDLNVCSKRGLSERFDSTIGAGTVLMPFGGARQLTPSQVMVQKISVERGHTDDVSVMSWGFDPDVSEASPYHGAYLAVVESVCKLIASGASFDETYLTFQEYFEKPGTDPARWGKPLAALLGAFRAQTGLGVGSIGGKDSMSGSFEKLDVPPTLVSFAVTKDSAENIISPDFKAIGRRAVLLSPETGNDGLPTAKSLLSLFEKVTSLIRSGRAVSAYTPTSGGVAEAIMKMAMGNGFGFRFDDTLSLSDLFGCSFGSFILEVADDGAVDGAKELGRTAADAFTYRGERVSADTVYGDYEGVLEGVYRCNDVASVKAEPFTYKAERRAAPRIKCAKPTVLIPVFPGTNCEYDSAKAVRDAGAEAKIIVVKNLSPDDVSASVEEFASELKNSQMIFIPGGVSGGDEPDGSGKFITAFFRNGAVKEGVTDLLDRRDGLILGICNGFQALIKLGLVPYGKIIDTDENCPTLTFNTIARHQSKIVRTRVASNMSPWLALTEPGEIYSVPISHGEGRFFASEELIRSLAERGQIATQ